MCKPVVNQWFIHFLYYIRQTCLRLSREIDGYVNLNLQKKYYKDMFSEIKKKL